MGNTRTRSIEFVEKGDADRIHCLCIDSQIAKVFSGKSSDDLELSTAIDFAEREEETQKVLLLKFQECMVEKQSGVCSEGKQCNKDPGCNWCQYKTVHSKIFQNWKNVILISMKDAKLTQFLCFENRLISSSSKEAAICEAQGFCYLASNLLRFIQTMRYIETLETSRIQKDYKDVLAYSQRSTDLLYTVYGDELNTYSNEEAKEKSLSFSTATGLYLMGLNYQIIANCCLYDLTQNVQYLQLAYSGSCLLKAANAPNARLQVLQMDIEKVKRRLRYRAKASANVDSANEEDLRNLLIDNYEPYEFALRTMLNIDDTPSHIKYTRDCAPIIGSLTSSSKMRVARCETPVRSENDIIVFYWTQGRLLQRDLSNRHVCQTCYQCFLEQDFTVHVALHHP